MNTPSAPTITKRSLFMVFLDPVYVVSIDSFITLSVADPFGVIDRPYMAITVMVAQIQT